MVSLWSPQSSLGLGSEQITWYLGIWKSLPLCRLLIVSNMYFSVIGSKCLEMSRNLGGKVGWMPLEMSFRQQMRLIVHRGRSHAGNRWQSVLPSAVPGDAGCQGFMNGLVSKTELPSKQDRPSGLGGLTLDTDPAFLRPTARVRCARCARCQHLREQDARRGQGPRHSQHPLIAPGVPGSTPRVPGGDRGSAWLTGSPADGGAHDTDPGWVTPVGAEWAFRRRRIPTFRADSPLYLYSLLI